MKQLPNTTIYLLSSTLHGGKYFFLSAQTVGGGQCVHLLSFALLLSAFTDTFMFPSGHCKKLTPEYEAAAEVLRNQETPRTIAKVDATENKAIADRMQIKGFPTLYFFK